MATRSKAPAHRTAAQRKEKATVDDPKTRGRLVTKAELEAAAKVEGVDVKSSDTKAEIEEKLEQHAHGAQRVQLDLKTRRSGDEPLHGQFVDVVAGPHRGRYGYYESTSEYAADGHPSVLFVRTRDARNELLEVKLGDVRPSVRNGGR